MTTHTLKFSTNSPYDDGARALDMLRRMNFLLASFEVEASRLDCFMIKIIYNTQGTHTSRSLDAHLQNLPSVFEYQSG